MSSCRGEENIENGVVEGGWGAENEESMEVNIGETQESAGSAWGATPDINC